MSIRDVNPTTIAIAMDNKDNQITLKKNKDVVLKKNIYIRTAGQDIIDNNAPLRCCIYKRVTVDQA